MIAGENPLRFIVAGALAGAGLLIILGGAFGVVRFSDVFARLHAVRTVSYGAPLVLAGIAVESGDLGVALRLALVAAAIAVTGPALSHLMAQQAHRMRVEPTARR